MKLFDPEMAGCFIYAVVQKNAKEGTPPDYKPYRASSMEAAERTIDGSGLRAVYPFVLGRYDTQGLYETYRPPVEGVTVGRFTPHPLAKDEMRKERGF